MSCSSDGEAAADGLPLRGQSILTVSAFAFISVPSDGLPLSCWCIGASGMTAPHFGQLVSITMRGSHLLPHLSQVGQPGLSCARIGSIFSFLCYCGEVRTYSSICRASSAESRFVPLRFGQPCAFP